MPDFSVILQSPEVRSVVQENILERAFHDALFPRLLFRGEATPQPWPAGVGDTQLFSAPGMIPVNAAPLRPGVDPDPVTYPLEQWSAQLQQYAGTIDTHMPTSMVAIANLFLRNAHQLGLQGARTLNTITRNKMYGAALSGNSNVNGAFAGVAVIRLLKLNGFTRARNPNLAGGAPVRFDPVSSTNPLAVTIFDNGAFVAFNIIGFTPDVAGDEAGPGTVTLSANVTNVATRAAILANDRSSIVRVGGGTSVDALTGANIPTLSDVRSAVSQFWQQSVPEHADGRFHCHLDPVSQAKIFNDNEFQRLLTALPDYYMYKQFALGELLNTVFFRNAECPLTDTVVGNQGVTAFGNLTYDPRDPFPGELLNATNIKIHRMLFTSQGGMFEYYSDMSQLITDAGLNGKIGDPRVVNNGIEIMSERIQLIIRGPMNRLQDQVATSWKFIGDWPVRTDAATGGPARFKRFLAIEHGE
jgi:hypothetical protein